VGSIGTCAASLGPENLCDSLTKIGRVSAPQFVPAYRPDIDGLRAIAVVAVVLFHAFPSSLPGGFAGVDMFFTISGFLITGLLLRDHARGAFSLRHFYARRIQRIFPALALVLVACMGAGWLVLTADELAALGTFTSGGAAFLSNFLLWRASGYFDTAADTKPLLHLWSLGIEEQFYLVWPLLLWWWFRWPQRLGLWMGACVLASLAYSLWAVRVDAVMAFYSPLPRLWELGVGGLLAYALWRNPQLLQRYRSVAAYLGALLVALGLVLLDKGAAFPGWWALLPTLGTVLLIFSGDASWLGRRVLSSKALVAVGLISYPLYLWHWPLLSFARILLAETPPAEVRAALVAASVVLAWLTYRWVERPIRFGGRLDGRFDGHAGGHAGGLARWKVPTLCSVMLLVFLAGYVLTANHGFKSRHHARLNADPATMVNGADRSNLLADCLLAPSERVLFEWCMRDQKPVSAYVVLGDSKGESLFFGLSRETAGPRGWRLLGPVQHVAGDAAPLSRVSYQAVEQDPNVEVVVFANALRGMFALDPQSGFVRTEVPDADIEHHVETYSRAFARFARAGKRSVFVVDNPSLPDPNSCVSGAMTGIPLLSQLLVRRANPYCTVRYTDHLQGTRAYQEFVQRLKVRNPDVLVFDPTPLLCDIPANVCTITEGRNFLYSYGDHISDYASSKIARQLLAQLFPAAQQ
jgi:peptidoglycan/LPS O-acetylase OafA/YrhL